MAIYMKELAAQHTCFPGLCLVNQMNSSTKLHICPITAAAVLLAMVTELSVTHDIDISPVSHDSAG